MKNMRTKSINKPKAKIDGLRICVMRRIRPEYRFDIWIPKLAPSEKLLKRYVIQKKITWKKFSQLYTREVLSKKQVKEIIKALVFMSQSSRMTLLCGENSAKRCHRSLIIRECMKQKITSISQLM